MVFLRPDIFKPMKYILVSATADESICKQFLDDADMDSHQCKQAKYKGKLLQYPGRSMSRSSIASDTPCFLHWCQACPFQAGTAAGSSK